MTLPSPDPRQPASQSQPPMQPPPQPPVRDYQAYSEQRQIKPTMHPRKVIGGIRLKGKEGPILGAWTSQRWMRLVENSASGPSLAEGLRYGKLGQTRAIEVTPGVVTSRVQGRMPGAYTVTLRLPTFTASQWSTVLDAMSAQATYVAGLLAGDVAASVEDVFAPLGLRLCPSEPGDVALSCTCGYTQPMCKHACCVMAILAERLTSDAYLIFELRGLAKDDLVEGLRQRRALSGALKTAPGTSGAPGAVYGRAPVYVPQIPGLTDLPAAEGGALPTDPDQFWNVGPGLGDLELPIGPPEVSHPLLRRLGPSPFEGAKFPLLGLLTTCYEVLSHDAIRGETGAPDTPADHPEGADEE